MNKLPNKLYLTKSIKCQLSFKTNYQGWINKFLSSSIKPTIEVHCSIMTEPIILHLATFYNFLMLIAPPAGAVEYTGYISTEGGCPRGVMVKAMDCRIRVNESILQSHYYNHFQANTLGKGMNPLILPAMG